MGDLDYINARFAYFNAIPHIFWWSASQAVEKYMKSILLINDESVTGIGHNLLDLNNKLTEIKIDFSEELLISGNENIGVIRILLPEFLEKINEYGNPDCRYGLDGSGFDWQDLFFLDQLAFKLRRRIEPLNKKTKDNSCVISKWLDENPKEPYLKTGKIWEIISDEKHKLRYYLSRSNSAFLSDQIESNCPAITCGNMGGLFEASEYYIPAGEEGDSCKVEIRNWLDRNWKLSKSERDQIAQLFPEIINKKPS